MAVAFKKAVKAEAKLRMALTGPSGSGKTYTALSIATALADDAPVAVLDTERGSASKYSELFPFDVVELEPPYHPDRYIEVVRAAVEGHYAVLIIDSLSHAWNGQGGLLELNEQIAKRSYQGNTFRAWAETTPVQNRLIDALTSAPLHLIVTMRSKTEYVVESNDRGKSAPKKVGTTAIQRDGMEYEFDVVGDLTQDNELIVHKSRCPQLAGAVIAKPGAQVADVLADWLRGAPVAERPVVALATSQQAVQRPKTVVNWSGLRKRAVPFYPTVEDWETMCKRLTHKEHARTYTNADYDLIDAHISSCEVAADAEHEAVAAGMEADA